MEPFDELTTRRERLQSIIDDGVAPYQSAALRTHEVANFLAGFDSFKESDQLGLAGRIVARRTHGGATFLNINDGTATVQIYIKKDEIGDGAYADLDNLDLGDFIEIVGNPFVTKRGENSLLVKEPVRLLTKALRPLPEKWHGLSDIEIRYRKRYLDLLANPEVKATALARAEIIKTIRNILSDSGFIEVETPILQVLPGGATARPFITHHNVLDMDLYLRVAPELYLKRLLVGGLTKVYEVARCFRNEGIDHAHNPEFTQIELYEAYSDYNKLMVRLENLLVELVNKTNGGLKIKFGEGELDFTPPFPRLDWVATLEKALTFSVADKSDDELRQALRGKGVEILDHEGRGAMLDAAYKKFVRPHITQPTFLINHPISLSPLAKKHPTLADRTERFQLVLGGGIELMNGFSELNDPLDQASRFAEQEELRAAGDDEAQRVDDDYIEALEYGMPPAAGVGIGIDRLVAVLTNNHTLKEVILFPTLRPKND
jgi:lysyl-tRNA synthetase, class II